jgi:hypothetical protein
MEGPGSVSIHDRPDQDPETQNIRIRNTALGKVEGWEEIPLLAQNIHFEL